VYANLPDAGAIMCSVARREQDLYETYGPRSVPRPGEPGHTPLMALEAQFRPLAEEIFARALALWEDPDVAGWLQAWLCEAGVYSYTECAGDPLTAADWASAPLHPDEFADVIGLPGVDAYVVADLYAQIALDYPDDLTIAAIAWQLADYVAAQTGRNPPSSKPRLVLVGKDEAARYIAIHHAALPYLNPRGLLYTIGVKVGPRLVAVGTVNTPSGAFKQLPAGCTIHGITDLTRVASDGTVKGASSMIAARAIDLLPVSGRDGHPGCLFVTYSLLSEKGTTYLALVDRGLRPTGLTKGGKPSGARKGAGEASLATVSKIRWQAGPAAAAPAWELLQLTSVPPDQITRVAGQFDQWAARQAKQAAARAAATARRGARG
jgi:hypothetical protein